MASREELKAKKEKTSQALIQAALQLSAEDGYASLSLRSVARKAGIAPTSFYRHFRDMDELGLSIVDQAANVLNKYLNKAAGKMLLQAGECDASSDNLLIIIKKILPPFVETLMACFENHNYLLHLFLQERTGSFQALRDSISHGIDILAEALFQNLKKINIVIGNPFHDIRLISETMILISCCSGLEMMVCPESDCLAQNERTIQKLAIFLIGASMV